MRLRSQGSVSPPPPEDANGEKKRSSQSQGVKGLDENEISSVEFHLLKTERMAIAKQAAEETRQKNLGRIAGMNSRSGINPLERFPKEIWDKILNDSGLTPKDRYNLCQVHPLFNDLMERAKIQDILLPLIMMDLKIPLLKMLLLTDDDGEDVDMRQVSNLRRVSKNVRLSMDKWFEDEILFSMRNNEYSVVAPRLDFDPFPDMLNRLVNFPRRQGDPKLRLRPCRFFPRSIQMDFHKETNPPDVEDEDEEEQNRRMYQNYFSSFKRNFTEFLKTVGDQIWCFSLGFYDMIDMDYRGGVTLAEVYSMLREWLKLIPNLKWLQLGANDSREIYGSDKRIPGPPMPTLRDLQRVDIIMDSKHRGFRHWDCIFRSNPHVKSATFYADKFTNVTSQVPPLVLESVNLKADDVSWNMPMLERITNWNWNLHKLVLEMNGNGDSIDKAFCWMESFPLLEDVALKIDDVQVRGEELRFLQLPNLKHFKLELGSKIFFAGEFRRFISLDFLLRCEKLESLEWSLPMLDAAVSLNGNEGKALINFKGGFGDISQSNVWDFFPKLKLIRVKIPKPNPRNPKMCIARLYGRRKLISEIRKIVRISE